jgi:hypothetical protein
MYYFILNTSFCRAQEMLTLAATSSFALALQQVVGMALPNKEETEKEKRT